MANITFDDVVRYLTKTHNMPEHVARGIAGNLAQESSFNPKAFNGTHRGLPQWDKTRYSNFNKWAVGSKKNVEDPYAQLDFVVHELNTTHKKAMSKLGQTKTPEEAAKVIFDHYEMPGDGSLPKRQQIASKGFKGSASYNTEEGYSPSIIKTKALKSFEQPLWTPETKKYSSFGSSSTSSVQNKDLSLGQTSTKPSIMAASKQYQFKGLGDLIPYVSNLYSATQKPAAIPAPFREPGVHLQRVNFNNDRYEANKGYRGVMLNADQTLDGNSAAAVKAYGLAQKFGQVSKINQEERNQNNMISNREAEFNQGVASRNLQRNYEYNLANMDRKNRIMSSNMANLSNAADKYVSQQEQNDKKLLEENAMAIYAANDPYGTYARLKEKTQFRRFGGNLTNKILRLYKPI